MVCFPPGGGGLLHPELAALLTEVAPPGWMDRLAELVGLDTEVSE